MTNEKEIRRALSRVIHPESGIDIVSSGILEEISVKGGKISLTLSFKSRDPLAVSIKKQSMAILMEAFPQFKTEDITILIKEAAPQKPSVPQHKSSAEGIGKVIAIASGKGGVGKSTVSANMAVTLAGMGYRVGLLDADIYGPSQPRMFGVEDYVPQAVSEGGQDLMVPASAYGVEVMSIGFFIDPKDALVWRGPMATNALKQLIHQTRWGKLDYLLIDLPPGTGDVHLTIIQEIKPDGAVIVSTPQGVAVDDVRRGIAMLRSEGIEVPVLGLIENMAWFTPAELPQNRYYIFGRGGAAELAKKEKLELLGEIPIIQAVMEGAERGRPNVLKNKELAEYYQQAAEKVVEKLG